MQELKGGDRTVRLTQSLLTCGVICTTCDISGMQPAEQLQSTITDQAKSLAMNI